MPGFSNDNFQTAFTALTLAATITGWLFDRYVVRRRRLSYRVHWNRPVDVTPAVAHNINLSIVRDGQLVAQPSVVVLRVENVGSLDLEPEHILEPLDCSFGGRRIVHLEVQESDPPELADAIRRPRSGPAPQLMEYHPGEADAAVDGVLRLPAVALARHHRFKLLVLLAGPGTEVSMQGRLAGGEVVREGRGGPRSVWGLALGGASLLLVGLLVGLIATRSRSAPAEHVACPVPGALSVSGSTALAPVMVDLAARYAVACPQTRVQVTGNGTNLALNQLINGGRADQQTQSNESSRVKLVMADEYAGQQERDPQLGYWPVGISAFAVVVNQKASLAQLSSAQIRQLFAGRLPRWNAGGLGGADVAVVLVSRTTDSGTRGIFENRVLHGVTTSPVSSTDCLSRDIPDRQANVMHCELRTTQDVLAQVSNTPGAIGYVSAAEARTVHDSSLQIMPIDGYSPTKEDVASGRYRFWGVERLYRYGPERPPTVRDHFVQYVTAQQSSADVLEKAGLFRCNDPAFLDGETAGACIPSAPPVSSPSAGPPSVNSPSVSSLTSGSPAATSPAATQ